MVARWARLAGPENVTVVIGDKAHPDVSRRRSRPCSGLPPHTLDPPRGRGFDTNRSFSAEEVSLFLQDQPDPRPGKMTEDELTRILRGARWPGSSTSAPHRATTPPWPCPRGPRDGRVSWADATPRSLPAPAFASSATWPSSARPPAAGRHTMPDLIPVELAAQAVIGAMSGRLHRGFDFRRPLPEPAKPSWKVTRRALQRRTAKRARRASRRIASLFRPNQGSPWPARSSRPPHR